MTHMKPGKNDWIVPFVVAYVTVIGAAVRLVMPLQSPIPLNDGGLFHAMIADIQGSQFALPQFTTYNSAQIPLAYPPLALYFTAIISSLFHVSIIDLLRLLPPIINALCIPAFFLLARDIMESETQALLSMSIFAFLPRTLDWLIMGGGITRSFGLLFALLAIRHFYILFVSRSRSSILPAILFGALTVYSHPEAAAHAAITALIFYLLKDRSRVGFLQAGLVALGVGLATAPWWLTVVLRHGADVLAAPLLAAGQDNPGLPARLFLLFSYDFTDEPYLTLIGVLGLVGLAVMLVRRKYLMPAWIVILAMIEPRGGRLYMMIPQAMMAAVSLVDLILPGLMKFNPVKGALQSTELANAESAGGLLGSKTTKIVVGFIFTYGIMSAAILCLNIYQNNTLKPADLDAFQWTRKNTHAEDRFVLLTGGDALLDPSSEWFPAVTGRKSLGTVFGYEWINDGRFARRKTDYYNLQDCANQNETCLDTWSEETSQAFNYVYIRKIYKDKLTEPALVEHLALSEEYSQVYDSSGVTIFQYLAGNK